MVKAIYNMKLQRVMIQNYVRCCKNGCKIKMRDFRNVGSPEEVWRRIIPNCLRTARTMAKEMWDFARCMSCETSFKID